MAYESRLKSNIKRTLRHMGPTRIARAQITKRVISKFVDKIGLVYFGGVDLRDEDQKIVRGHTVSRSQIDSNYCIGTVRGYDVVLVLRNDIVRTKNGCMERCHWLIYTVDLHTKQDLPHIYIGHKSRDDLFAASYERIYPINLGILGQYPENFADEYTVYSTSAHQLEVEGIITPHIATVMADKFYGASIEISENTIYSYIESQYPSENLLEKLLSNSLWLAEAIDSAYLENGE